MATSIIATEAHGSWRDLLMPCAAYAIAVLIFNISPIEIGVLMDKQSLGESPAALVVTAEMVAMAVTGFLLGPLLSRASRKSVLFGGAVILIAGNVISQFTNDFTLLMVARGLAGLGAGFLFIYANTRIASARDPVQAFGLASIAATVIASLILFVGPVAVGQVGKLGLYVPLIALAVWVGFKAIKEPVGRIHVVKSQKMEGFRLSIGLLVLLAVCLFVIAAVQCAYFAFAERMAKDIGISSETIGGVLAAGFVGGIVTSAIASVLSTRRGRWIPMAIGIGLQAIFSIIVCLTKDASLLLIGAAGQSLALFFGLPYLLGTTADADASGRFANVGACLFFLGLALGPFLGGVVIESYGAQGIALIVAVGTALALLGLVPVTRALNHALAPKKRARSTAQQVILITGASSGFGQAMALRLAEAGHTVFGTSRSPKGDMGAVRMLKLDVTDDASAVQAVAEVIQSSGRIDVLINNAGGSMCGAVQDTAMDEMRWQMETNFFGVARMTHSVLPQMRKQGGGRIITVSSLAGAVGLPFQPYYSASKHAIEGFSEALRLELHGTGIDAVTMMPGDFKTGFTGARVYSRQAKSGHNTEQLVQTMAICERDELNGADPTAVADLALKLVQAHEVGVRYAVGRFDQRMTVLVKRLIPATWFEGIMKETYNFK